MAIKKSKFRKYSAIISRINALWNINYTKNEDLKRRANNCVETLQSSNSRMLQKFAPKFFWVCGCNS
ncbi:hypothetical protein HZS_4996 [Henneguya salminicola]|nr:hypothetical protein HZS_4996 [Henneguya salminicola]